MRNVVFLVKNGIGLGHLRRALILAEALLDAGQFQPVIISQANSLALLADPRVPVVNFPLLHRVPSAIAEDWYTDVLDHLLMELDPAAVVEDTYPDKRYASLGSLADRPRLLVLRRLDNASFDTIRITGAFGRYDQILIAQDEESFRREGHSTDTLAAVTQTGRFEFAGPIFRPATSGEVDAVRAQYAPDGVPLVVVNGGAGGDQMPDGYGDRLFHACATVAARLAAEDHPARFIMVTGPYYAGRALREQPNVVVRRYEPRLNALLAAAQVAVIKPGNNALSEALAGSAHLVLVPDVSFMEGTSEHAARVIAEYGGYVAVPEAEVLEPLIREALVQPPRAVRLNHPPSKGVARVAAAVHRLASETNVVLDPYQLLLIVRAPARFPVTCRGALVVGEDIVELADVLAAASTIGADVRRPERFHRHVRSAFASSSRACVLLDLRAVAPEARAQEYLDHVGGWLESQPVRLVGPAEYRASQARQLLEAR